MAKRSKSKRGKAKRAAKRGKSKRAAAKRVQPIPAGFHTVSPYLAVKGAASAIDFYKRAFGAKEKVRMSMPDGRIMHAELRIGDSVVMLADEFEGSGQRSPEAAGTTTVAMSLYVRDVDRAFARAVEAGARVAMPVADMFWGDRFGRVVDPFGHGWAIATHREDVKPAELRRRAAQAFSAPPPAAGS